MISSSLCLHSSLILRDVVIGQLLNFGQAAFSSSSEIVFSLSAFLSLSFSSRRMLRTAVLCSSAISLTTFASCLRRSSVSGGIGMRISLPSLAG